MRLRNILLTAAVCCVPLLTNTHAETPATTKHDEPTPQTVPFPKGRGPAPLEMAIGGLKDASAHVAAGARIFGICWLGGLAPYSVVLSDAKGTVIVNETDLDAHELVKSSKLTHLDPGTYKIAIDDIKGNDLSGQFTVVAKDAMPKAPVSPDSDAKTLEYGRWLMAQGPAYQYEAYLTLLPLTIKSQDSDASRLVDQICQRNG